MAAEHFEKIKLPLGTLDNAALASECNFLHDVTTEKGYRNLATVCGSERANQIIN
jgi:hypothetical protein